MCALQAHMGGMNYNQMAQMGQMGGMPAQMNQMFGNQMGGGMPNMQGQGGM